jgi:hypothetical protein
MILAMPFLGFYLYRIYLAPAAKQLSQAAVPAVRISAALLYCNLLTTSVLDCFCFCDEK